MRINGMKTKKVTNLDQELNDILIDLDLPDKQSILYETIVEKREQRGWKQKNEQRYENPEYSKRVGKKISETYSTPYGRSVQASKSKPHTEAAKKKIADANIGLIKSPEIRKKLSEKKIGNNNRARPIVTPLGIFPSKKHATEAYLTSGKTNAMKWIDKWLKTDKENFYYITKEEYILLTGKDI